MDQKLKLLLTVQTVDIFGSGRLSLKGKTLSRTKWAAHRTWPQAARCNRALCSTTSPRQRTQTVFRVGEDLCQVLREVQPNSNEGRDEAMRSLA